MNFFFENMNFMMYWRGIKYLKNIFMFYGLMNYHNMIWVLHLNKSGLRILNFNNHETYGNKRDS